MKLPLLLLCACALFVVDSRAQRPAGESPATLPATPGEHAKASPGQAESVGDPPILFVYVARYNDNIAPRIALGLEKPILKISAFEKCVRLSQANPNLNAIAAQLTGADAETLVAAIKSLAAPDARTLPDVILWFATPDNQLLDSLGTANTNAEANIVQAGVLDFYPGEHLTIVQYLSEKLHLR